MIDTLREAKKLEEAGFAPEQAAAIVKVAAGLGPKVLRWQTLLWEARPWILGAWLLYVCYSEEHRRRAKQNLVQVLPELSSPAPTLPIPIVGRALAGSGALADPIIVRTEADHDRLPVGTYFRDQRPFGQSMLKQKVWPRDAWARPATTHLATAPPEVRRAELIPVRLCFLGQTTGTRSQEGNASFGSWS
jgi:hypothetical protein